MDKNKELTEIKASIEILDKKYRESKGYGEYCDKPCPAEVEDVMYQMISNVYRYIENISNDMYRLHDNHINNYTHLPKLTPSQTEKLLKAAGASEDFDVQKKIIWATDRNGIKNFTAELNIPKKSQ